MRLRNLFMILLLCMTVGVLGASCTGDDGEAGPPGPQGPPGPPGESMDGEDTEPTAFYDFLKSWGSEDGEVACSDSLLTGMGPLPGPELEDILLRQNQTGGDPTPNVDEGALNSPIIVDCTTELELGTWGDVEMVKVGKTTQAISADATGGATVRNIVLWKSGRATMEHEGDPVLTPKNDFSLAKATMTKKEFVGGTIYSNIPNTGGDEGFERASLHTQCGVGTSPANIMGTWRAVKVTDTVTSFESSKPVPSTDAVANPAVLMSLLKVCVTLDAHPGTTKCYVSKLKADGTTRAKSINLYNDEGLVMPPVVAEKKLPGDSTTDQEEFLFDDGPGTTNDQEDFGEVENLCALFSQGVKP